MKKLVFLCTCVFLLSMTSTLFAVAAPHDMEGSDDSPLFSRMNGFYISNYQAWDFDRYESATGPDKTHTVEGRHVHVDYYANDGIKLPSALQTTRNHINALVKQHGIGSARLTPIGAGPKSPAAANTSDQERARNRSVELVAQ